MSLSFYNQGARVAMELEEFVTTRPHAGRRGSPAIPTGTTLYAIRYVHPEGGYFTYSYLNREVALQVMENSRLYRTDTEFYREWNLVKDKEDTLHYGGKAQREN